MTSIIRSTRVAAELKALPATPATVETRKPQALTSASGPSKPADAPVITYDEYKQRFAAELAEAHRKVIDSAREQGLQQGRQAAELEYRQQLESLRALLESVREARNACVENVADDAAEIVFAALVRLLGEGFADQSAVSAAVREAIRQYKTRGKLLVRVAPRDFELLEARRRELLEGTSASEIELTADEQVALGGCVLEGAGGNLDARLETQLQHLREALVRARAKWDEPDE